ncbi:MAG TPA: FlgD immunoglobulin-like domain containing protein, partial [Gemmatimonadaceae bacterium]
SLGLETPGPTWTFTTLANLPPQVPYAPHPGSGATSVPITDYIGWSSNDPNGQTVRFDVYFGTDDPPPLIAADITDRFVRPAMSNLTTYRWRVVARDPLGLVAEGPLWSFTTEPLNNPPNVPVIVTPADGATGLAVNTKISWQASDPEGDALEYDVYFGTAADPPAVRLDQQATTHDPGKLAASTTYRWRIVARDVKGHETSSPVWQFSTASTTSLPPSIPTLGYPADGSTTHAFLELHWFAYDPEGTQLVYDVYVVRASTWEIVGAYHTTAYVQTLGPLRFGEQYKWWVQASDGYWTVQSPTWTFRVEGPVPVLFSSFSAAPSGDAVKVDWEIVADEAVATFALYRKAGAGNEVLVGSGAQRSGRGSFLDRDVEYGTAYSYQLVITSNDGSTFRSLPARVTTAVHALVLHQNVPNPFNPQTTIRYDLPAPAHVTLTIFDSSGRRIRTLVDDNQAPGSREAIWTGRDDGNQPVSSGVYFYVLEAGKQRLTRKLVLLK